MFSISAPLDSMEKPASTTSTPSLESASSENSPSISSKTSEDFQEALSMPATVVNVAMESIVDNGGDRTKSTSQVDANTNGHKTEATSSSECQSGRTASPPETSSSETECSRDSGQVLARKMFVMTFENAPTEALEDVPKEKTKLAPSSGDEQSSGSQYSEVPGLSQALRDSKWKTTPDQIERQIRYSNDLAPRPYPHQQYYNATRDKAELRRLQPQLVKTEQNLRVVREENRMLKRKLENQPHRKTNDGLLGLFQEVINKQAELQTEKATLAKKELDLRAKVAGNARIEIFLSEGQKQLKNSLEEQGLRTATELELEHARAEGEAVAHQKFRNMETQIADRQMKANLREAELDFRQRHWKLDAHDGLETELRATLRSEIRDEIAKLEYEQGFQDGKVAGLNDNAEDAKHEGFLQGYEAARKAQDKLAALKKGTISHDSTDLEFLFDFSHPQNPFNLGRQLGSREQVSIAKPIAHRPCIRSQIMRNANPNLNNSNGSNSPAVSMEDDVREGDSRIHNKGFHDFSSHGSGINSASPTHSAAKYDVQYPDRLNNQRFTANGHVVQANEQANTERTVPNLMDL